MGKLILKKRKPSLAPTKRCPTKTNQSWEAFVEWSQPRGLNPLPANPWTVAAYARSMEGKYKPDTIRKRIAQLARIHTQKTRKRLYHHPMVQQTLDIIDRRLENDKRNSGLFTDDDFLHSHNTKISRRKKAGAKIKKTQKTLESAWHGLKRQPRLVSRRSLKR